MKQPRQREGADDGEGEGQKDGLPFPAASTEEGELPAFETPEAVIHFRFLVNFVEKYLAKPLERYRKLRDGLEERVSFEDLWMLFSTGDTIYSPSVRGGVIFNHGDNSHTAKTRHIPQLFRVLGTKGGLPFQKTLATSQAVLEAEVLESHTLSELLLPGYRREVFASGALDLQSYRRSKTTFTSLYVLCFNIDFDGVKYGTVREFFVFKPFNGFLDIRSLEAYPVKYLKPQLSRPLGEDGKAEYTDPLVERGRKFIDVTAVSHLSYEGLTVGYGREEVGES